MKTQFPRAEVMKCSTCRLLIDRVRCLLLSAWRRWRSYVSVVKRGLSTSESVRQRQQNQTNSWCRTDSHLGFTSTPWLSERIRNKRESRSEEDWKLWSVRISDYVSLNCDPRTKQLLQLTALLKMLVLNILNEHWIKFLTHADTFETWSLNSPLVPDIFHFSWVFQLLLLFKLFLSALTWHHNTSSQMWTSKWNLNLPHYDWTQSKMPTDASGRTYNESWQQNIWHIAELAAGNSPEVSFRTSSVVVLTNVEMQWSMSM